VSRATDRLVAIDGVNSGALAASARELATLNRQHRAAISRWDASGIFGEVALADVGSGEPSARTLLLLYAADLAFRLRWEVRPALAAGRMVIVTPYVDTAVAFGRAAGIDPEWLADMFGFAPRPGVRQLVSAPAARSISHRKGFVEFGCRQVLGEHAGAARLELIKRTELSLKTLARANTAKARRQS
jgi:thymidylate kinase